MGVKNSFLQNCETKEKQKRRLAASARGGDQSISSVAGQARKEYGWTKKGVGKVKADPSSLAFSIENWQN